MPTEIWAACTVGGDGINVQTLHLLQTVFDLDDLDDILEMAAIQRTWVEAATKNARVRADRERQLAELRRMP